MRFIPILFSTPMVQAIIEGRKTQTRRIIKGFEVEFKSNSKIHYSLKAKSNYAIGLNTEIIDLSDSFLGITSYCPYGKVGDVLWVRETSYISPQGDFVYKADYKVNQELIKWKPSIFMPKSACRIFLEITNVRVERLQDISDEDARAEGTKSYLKVDEMNHMKGLDWVIKTPFGMHQFGFLSLWCKINGTKSWESNPFVWVIEFKKIDKPENFI